MYNIRGSKNMSETISIPEESTEKKEKIYYSVSEYLSAFEESPEFNEVLVEREKQLSKERPDIKLERQDLIDGLRMVHGYRYGLENFFRAGNVLPDDLNCYSQEAKKEIEAYWDVLKKWDDVATTIRATAKDKEDEDIKMFRWEKTRDRFHTFAGLALLGDGMELKNGRRIICDEISDGESALTLGEYAVLGRSLVSLITEKKGLDYFDPDREEKKMEATLQFLNGLNYSSGHWVAKGER